MSLAARLRSTLGGLFRRRRLEAEMAEELEFHIQEHAATLRASGHAPDDALRRARLAFGAVEARKEECRASLGLRLFDELRADLRLGWRQLRRSPGFAIVAVLSLALGIGANTAVYTLARAVLSKPMGVPQPDELRLFSWVRVNKDGRPGPAWGSFDRTPEGALRGTPFPYPLYAEMRRHNTALRDLAAFKDVYKLSVVIDGEAEAVDAMLVSGNFYTELRAPVARGRALGEADDAPASAPVAVLSDAYWAERFGRAPDVVGRLLRVNGIPVTVVGINAPGFDGPKSGGSPALFLPLALQPRVHPASYGDLLGNAGFWWLNVIGRIKNGVSDTTAQTTLAADFENAFRATLPGKRDQDRPRFELLPGRRGLDGQTIAFRQPLAILLGLAGTVLLIAAVNLANLLLARAAGREREMSVRLAIGAGRGRVLRQVFTEALLLATLGGGAGILLGTLGRNLLPALFEDGWSGPPLRVEPDVQVFLFSFALILATALLFGAAPAWRAVRGNVERGLRAGGRNSAGRSRTALGRSLVAAEVGLSMLLLVGAGLFLRTLTNLRGTDLGLSVDRLVLVQIDPPRSRYAGERRVDLFARLEERLATAPGVEGVTASSEPLLANSTSSDCFRPAERAHDAAAATDGGAVATPDPLAWTNLVGPSFFSTYHIPIVAGRGFLPSDTARAPRVAVANLTLVRKLFPQGAALGRRLVECDPEGDPRPIEIVGVSADAKFASLRDAPPPTLYLPYRQANDLDSLTFELATGASPASLLPALRDAARAVDPDLPVLDVRTQRQQIDATMAGERVFATLASTFGGLALVLAGIGVYGLMAYRVAGRTHEIGIRLALGARAREVLRLVLGEASGIAVVGVVVGLGAAFAFARLLRSMLFGLEPGDRWTFAAAALLLLGVALAAGAIPAVRAARVDANRALRHE